MNASFAVGWVERRGRRVALPVLGIRGRDVPRQAAVVGSVAAVGPRCLVRAAQGLRDSVCSVVPKVEYAEK
ncbi:hypothetical protein TPA0910_23070 [Streptomyces hygroscopicus subsp. sporocinereus]|uniref:Uncharacterized protein n=1 Tax=Streptomyces hygroscopicus TaxID=1912 RepID=A0ABQ3TX13_STRHY|nr:hypothetical protein TPA0910_23070 [Streptomyces hygroscopicus]